MPFLPAPHPSGDTERVNLRAYRVLLLLAAVAVPGLWVLDQVRGGGYGEPVTYRLALSLLGLAIVGATYVSEWARAHVRTLSVALICLGSAYLSSRATTDGLPAPWISGILLAAGTGGLTLSMFAGSQRQITWSLAFLLASVTVPMFVTPAASLAHSPFTFSVEITLAMAAVYVAGIARLQTLSVLAESRRQLEAERDQGEHRERLLRTVMDSIPDAIYVNDADGRCVVRNQASVRQLRLDDRNAGLGLTGFDLFPEEEAQIDWALQQRVVATGTPALDRLLATGDDGEAEWYECSMVPLLSSHGQATGVVGVVRDVTEHKRTERELIEARDTAEHAARAKSEFLANMSHEIRTPMNGVVGMADLLSDSELTADQAECVRTIQTCADALLALISDILDLSKIEAQGVEIEAVPFSPRELVRDAVAVVRTGAQSRGLALAVDVAGDVPGTVLGDPTRIRQVLLNLLSNAVKFTHRGGVSVHVTAAGLPPSGLGAFALRFAVRDTGVGIAPDKRASLFDAFTQADTSTTREYGGTGLGLAISARLVALMGGEISVDGRPGEGSTFAFDVQAEALPDLPLAASETDRAVSASASAPAGLRVLAAEDNAVNQRVISRLLDRLGATTDLAADGAQALAMLHHAAHTGQPYDVVLMDVQMPVMDGHEATRRLRSELPPEAQPHVIALTANAMAGDREACLEAGADDYLTKPVRREALETALDASRQRHATSLAP